MKLLMKNLVKPLLVNYFLKKFSDLYIKIIFCLGCRDKKIGQILKDVIQTDYFRVCVVDDVEAVEICGALKVLNLSSLNQ